MIDWSECLLSVFQGPGGALPPADTQAGCGQTRVYHAASRLGRIPFPGRNPATCYWLYAMDRPQDRMAPANSHECREARRECCTPPCPVGWSGVGYCPATLTLGGPDVAPPCR